MLIVGEVVVFPPVLEFPPDDEFPPVWFPPDDELPPELLEEMEMYVFFCTQEDDPVHNLTYTTLLPDEFTAVKLNCSELEFWYAVQFRE